MKFLRLFFVIAVGGFICGLSASDWKNRDSASAPISFNRKTSPEYLLPLLYEDLCSDQTKRDGLLYLNRFWQEAMLSSAVSRSPSIRLAVETFLHESLSLDASKDELYFSFYNLLCHVHITKDILRNHCGVSSAVMDASISREIALCVEKGYLTIEAAECIRCEVERIIGNL